jgi:hypothetical protein
MLRCEKCGGIAVLGLAHLHGLTQHLCRRCAQPYIDQNKKMARGTFNKIEKPMKIDCGINIDSCLSLLEAKINQKMQEIVCGLL